MDEHQAEDENGIVESLNDIQDEFKNVSCTTRHVSLAQ